MKPEKKIIEKKFTAWTMEELEKTFNLIETEENKNLNNWINNNIEISDLENELLNKYKKNIKENVRRWNERELSTDFIGPMMALVNFNTNNFRFFAEREISAVLNNYKIFGKPDGIIATGKWSPEKPLFFMSEYKKEQNPKGWPDAQNIAAMLVAQKLNEEKIPIYGAYIVGRNWFFMILEENNYSISNSFNATTNDIFKIIKILKHLKIILTK